MIMEKVTVSSKGQIAIPKAVRDALNLREGSKLTVEYGGGKSCFRRSLPGENCRAPQRTKI
jgi:AbrB family looped-hinge helix DNA binding protein